MEQQARQDHALRIESAPTVRRMGYRAVCSCGWSSRSMKTIGGAQFERDFHERVEALKAEWRMGATA